MGIVLRPPMAEWWPQEGRKCRNRRARERGPLIYGNCSTPCVLGGHATGKGVDGPCKSWHGQWTHDSCRQEIHNWLTHMQLWPCHHVISMGRGWRSHNDLRDKAECEGFCLRHLSLNLLRCQNFHALGTFSCWSTAPAITLCSRPASWWPGGKSYGPGNDDRTWGMVGSYLGTKKNPKSHGKWLKHGRIPWSSMLYLWKTLRASGIFLLKDCSQGMLSCGDDGIRYLGLTCHDHCANDGWTSEAQMLTARDGWP